MQTASTIFHPHSIITSLRSFTRDTSIRQKALKQKKAVIIENKKDKKFFVLLPPSIYDKLFEMYLDMRDVETVENEIKKKQTTHNWSDVQKKLDKKFNIHS